MLALTAIDSTIGRFNHGDLPDQQAIELFLSGLDPEILERFYDDNGDFMDVSRIRPSILENPDEYALKFTQLEISLNESGKVEGINFSEARLSGTVQFRFLPQSVTYLDMGYNALEGSLETALLPDGLSDLRIEVNEFSNTFAFNTLPQQLTCLSISANKFHGSADFRNLPQTLETLEISANDFSGDLCLDSLPPKLEKLDAGHNNFVGSVSFEKLPESLRILVLSGNSLSKEVVLTANWINQGIGRYVRPFY